MAEATALGTDEGAAHRPRDREAGRSGSVFARDPRGDRRQRPRVLHPDRDRHGVRRERSHGCVPAGAVRRLLHRERAWIDHAGGGDSVSDSGSRRAAGHRALPRPDDHGVAGAGAGPARRGESRLARVPRHLRSLDGGPDPSPEPVPLGVRSLRRLFDPLRRLFGRVERPASLRACRALARDPFGGRPRRPGFVAEVIGVYAAVVAGHLAGEFDKDRMPRQSSAAGSIRFA